MAVVCVVVLLWSLVVNVARVDSYDRWMEEGWIDCIA